MQDIQLKDQAITLDNLDISRTNATL